MELTIQAPAKVNLHLKILGARADGMHELVTLMQAVSVGDELRIALGGSRLEFTCNDPGLSRDNLAERAARAWFRAAGLAPRARLHLEKRLPVAAGLGGGSSDAAAALKGLNLLHPEAALSPGELHRLAASLGADVPFFLHGGTALCTETGEKINPWPEFPALHYVLINPGLEVPTAWVYEQWDLAWTNRPNLTKIYRPPSGNSQLGEILVNDLEDVTLGAFPELGAIKEELRDAGAAGTLMSGSGSTIFGVFSDPDRARRAARRLTRGERRWVCACRGIKANASEGEGQHGGDRGQGLYG